MGLFRAEFFWWRNSLLDRNEMEPVHRLLFLCESSASKFKVDIISNNLIYQIVINPPSTELIHSRISLSKSSATDLIMRLYADTVSPNRTNCLIANFYVPDYFNSVPTTY